MYRNNLQDCITRENVNMGAGKLEECIRSLLEGCSTRHKDRKASYFHLCIQKLPHELKYPDMMPLTNCPVRKV